MSAAVDKTTVGLKTPLTLTITVQGDLANLQPPAWTFPEPFVVAGQSQSTEFSMRGRVIERSWQATYVLVPQEAGTFSLGPFQLEHEGVTASTEAITIVVEKPAVPPDLAPAGPAVFL